MNTLLELEGRLIKDIMRITINNDDKILELNKKLEELTKEEREVCVKLSSTIKLLNQEIYLAINSELNPSEEPSVTFYFKKLEELSKKEDVICRELCGVITSLEKEQQAL